MSIDYERYDRQIRTFGKEATFKITNSSVAIIGLEKGLATEVAKNLALCGIQNLYLFNDGLVDNNDLTTGYYYTIDDIGKERHKILAAKINNLNGSIQVHCINKYEDLLLANIIICINQSNVEFYSKLARQNDKKFIILTSSNNTGYLFVDAGLNYVVTNISGENYEPVQILKIDDDGIVTTSGHDYQSGDTINISNLQGENVEQFNRNFIIESINKFTFKLCNFSPDKFKFINGTANYIDIPITINHEDYETQLLNPTISDIIKNYQHSDIEIVSVNSIMGSLVASEAIKLVSNKYLPITQWFTWSDPDLKLDYDKLSKSEFFIVGSGAIGCELLKNLAFLNVKKIIITDPDTIEKSNLSRQFLFRPDNIGQLKSEIASRAIKEMKPTLEIEYLSEKVGDNTINFTNRILKNENLTGVFNALDNIDARRFMDTQCFNHNIPLFESGTLGMKGNTQPVIPFITETYSNSNDPTNEKTFAVCTIKNFPNEIHHTIHWALDQFEFFNRAPNNINKWLLNKELTFTNDNEGIQMNKDIWYFTTKYNLKSYVEATHWAIDMFHENYYNQILQLLTNFPPDSLTSEGFPFWSAGKRCPKPITLDSSNELHLDFIESTVILLCKCVNLSTNFSRNDLIEIINNYKIPEKEEEKDILEINKETSINIGNPQILEKDDNYHIKWIMAASNLRAINYSIEIVDFYTTKGIAGKIIPAVSTTTSIVAGLITIEMIKYLCDNQISNYKSTFINLAQNTFVSAEPLEAKSIEIAGQKFNIWHKFIENKDLTVEEFLNKYNDLFKTTISMISIGSSLIYADFMDNDINKKFSEVIIELDNELDKENKYILTITTDDGTVTLPDITITKFV
jgi:ubiquitin-activating enzyme E1